MYTTLLSTKIRADTISIEKAALETLAYSDIFEYPLRIEEIHRYLSVRATLPDLQDAIDRQPELIGCLEDYYFLRDRQDLVPTRKRRESLSQPALRRALQIGRILGRLPFIRMVALTGSLALLNSEASADLDYMLVAARGRVWMARAFALLLGRLTRLDGYTLCPNLIISERSLAWRQRDVYTAREICQMIPIAGMSTYNSLRRVNDWTNDYLPNAVDVPPLTAGSEGTNLLVQHLGEMALRGSLGDRIEAWEMNRKIRRFTQQAGFGIETQFDAEVCQGNFLHHGAHTRQALQDRLAEFGLEPPKELLSAETQAPSSASGERQAIRKSFKS